MSIPPIPSHLASLSLRQRFALVWGEFVFEREISRECPEPTNWTDLAREAYWRASWLAWAISRRPRDLLYNRTGYMPHWSPSD